MSVEWHLGNRCRGWIALHSVYHPSAGARARKIYVGNNRKKVTYRKKDGNR